MAPIFPVIDTERYSSLPAAITIYSDIDFFKKEKQRQKKKKKSKRDRSFSSPLQDSQKLLRKKEYSSELKMRRDIAINRRKRSEREQTNFLELKANRANEKERLRQLFSIYAVQHGKSYRKPTTISRPQFPNLLKPNSRVEKKKMCSSSKEVVLPHIGSNSGKAGHIEDRK
ncbi:uncharacterized protein LOC116299001 [Actinia tenebrosa]|uniref:Uncharacterized protein LOC116299001 n=1 Tax=Actinia tenebrosa TaxID=6105 RepID=A0A6P8I684_ACTTE|nr:uncharacterized protein LOC116299001 [Actinia tenebrosa]